MARIVDGPEITGQVTHKQTGQAYGPVTVTVSPKVYTDREMTASVTSLTTDGTGVFSCYAPPGTYTFTTTAVDAQGIESVEVLGREGGTGVATAASGVTRQMIGVYSPLDPFFGAVATPDNLAVDSLAAIQARIDAAYSDGGGVVPIPAAFLLSGSLTVKAGVTLRGVGWERSRLKLANSTGAHMIVASTGQAKMGVENLVLDGNKENQVTASDAIHMDQGNVDTWYAADAISAGPTFLRRVLIGYCKGNGVQIGNTYNGSEMRLEDVYVYRCDAHGLYLNGCADVFVNRLTVGQCTLDNVYDWQGLGNRYADCKSWYAGRTGTRGSNAATTVATSHAYTFLGGNYQVTNCEAQDCSGHGYNLSSWSSRFEIKADANAGACVFLGGTATIDNDINLTVGDGSSHGTVSTYVVSGSNFPTRNRIRSNYSASGVAAAMFAVSVTGNDIIIGTPDAILPLGYQSTITPDPVAGSPLIALGGNITLANPAVDRKIEGTEFSVGLVQDATGSRTVTWGGDFIVATAIGATASQGTLWRFRCINAKWIEVNAKAGIVGMTVPTTVPGQVGTVTTTPGNTQVGLSWSAPNNGGAAITDYVIQYRTTAGPGAWTTFADGTSTATTATVTGLTNNTSYDFHVAAVNSVGQGAYSAAVTDTPVLLVTYISDTFVRANSTTSMGSPQTGGAWVADTGGDLWGINGNQAYNPSANFGRVTSDGGASATGTNGITARWTVGATPGSGIICYLDGSNYIQIGPTGLFMVVAGTGTAGGVANWPAAEVSGDTMRAVIDTSGTRLTIWKNGVQVGQTSHANVATLAPNHKHGLMGVGSAACRFGDGTSNADNFSVKSA